MAVNRIFKDFFTEGADTKLVDHTPGGFGSSWVEEEKTGVAIQRIQAADDFAESDTFEESSDRHIYTCRLLPGTAEYDLSVKLLGVAGADTDPWFFVGRFTDTNNYYSGGTYPALETADKKIFKKVTSTVTELASGDNGMAANDTLKFEIRDAAKKLYHNGSEVLTTPDNALTSIGSGGFGLGNAWVSTDDIRSAWQADDFTIDEFTTASIFWPDATEGDAEVSTADSENHSVSGSDTSLLVLTFTDVTDAGKEVSQVTWDPDGANQNLTEVADFSPSHGKCRVQVFEKIAPTAGDDKPIRFTFGSKIGFVIYTLNGVDQTTPTSDYTDDGRTATDPSVTVPNTVSSDLVMDALAHFDVDNAPTIGANQTLRVDFKAAGSHRTNSSSQDGADGGVMSWTLTQSKEFGLTGFNIKSSSGVTTFTVTTSLEAAVEKQLTLAASLNAGVQSQRQIATTADGAIASLNIATANLEAAVAAAGTAEANLQAAVRATVEKQSVLDAAMSRDFADTTELDAVLGTQVLVSAGVGAALKAAQEAAASLTAALQAEAMSETGLNAGLSLVQARQASLQAVIALLGTGQAAIDAAIERGQSTNSVLDSVVQAAIDVAASLDGVIGTAQALVVSLEAVLVAARDATASMDAAVAGAQFASTSAGAALIKLVAIAMTLDAALAMAQSAVTSFDAAIAQSGSAATSLDAANQVSLALSTGADAAVVSNVTRSTSLAAALQRTLSNIASLDATLISAGQIVASLDGILQSASLVVSASVDAALLGVPALSAALDAMLGQIVGPSTVRTFAVPGRQLPSIGRGGRVIIIPPGDRVH